MSTYDELVERINAEDKSVLQDPDIGKVHGSESSDTALHTAAEAWEDTLYHPDVSRARNKYGTTPLHYAANVWESALQHPDISKVKNKYGATPLHWATMNLESAWIHPEINIPIDEYGKTPLHYAAAKWESALQHPEINTTRDRTGETPLQTGARPWPLTALAHPAAKEMQENGDYLIHHISRMGKLGGLKLRSLLSAHQDFKTLKNLWGQTPKEVWGKPIESPDTNESDDGIYEE